MQPIWKLHLVFDDIDSRWEGNDECEWIKERKMECTDSYHWPISLVKPDSYRPTWFLWLLNVFICLFLSNC